MTPSHANINDLQLIYSIFSKYSESVEHTMKEGQHDHRSIRLIGVVLNTEATAFLRKSIELEVYTKDYDWADWAEPTYGRTDVCGEITIAANVERADDSPICVSVGVSLDLWRDFQQVARSAIDAGFHVGAGCGFWSPGEKLQGLDKLDISDESTYPLHSFKMGRSPLRLPSSS